MKRMVSLVVALGFVFFLPACDSGPSMDSPKNTMKSMIKAMKNGDTDTMNKLVVESEQQDWDKMEKKKKKKQLKQAKKMAESMEIKEVKDKKDDSAKVVVKVKMMGKEMDMPFPVKKVDGKWRLAKLKAK